MSNTGDVLDLVSIERTKQFNDQLVGHLWAQGEGVCVLSEMTDELALSGVVFIDSRHVKQVRRDFDRKQMYVAALENAVPSRLVGLCKKYNYGTKSALLNGVMENGAITALHMELVDPDTCFVGFVENVCGGDVVMKTVSSFGEILSGSVKLELDDVTKVEIGTGYLLGIERYINKVKKI